MNNRKMLYIFFISVIFNLFSLEVNAAKEMTCVYYDDKDAYKLVQKSDGTGSFHYASSSKVVVNGEVVWAGAWTKKKTLKNLYWFTQCLRGDVYGQKVSNSNNKTLTSCPKAILVTDGKNYIASSWTDDMKKSCVNSNALVTLELDKQVSKAYDSNSSSISNETTKDNNKKCSKINLSDKWINKNTSAYAACLYSYDLKDDKGCMTVQLDIKQNGAISPSVNLPKLSGLTISNRTSSTFNDYYIKNNYDGYCPKVYIEEETKKGIFSYTLAFDSESNGTWLPLTYEDSKGKNLNDSSKDISDYDYEGFAINFIDTRDQIVDCADIIGESGEIVDLLHMIVMLVKIIVPILVIVLGSLDFVSAIFAGDENNMKKVQSKFIKRLLIAVVIFLVPSLLHLILEIANNIWPIIDSDLCGIL